VVANARGNTVGEYNAATGAAINASGLALGSNGHKVKAGLLPGK